jgi:hypothetical protein
MNTIIEGTRLKERAIVQKLKAIEQDLSESRGSFQLFALTLREDAEDKWDLLVSAEWAQNNKAEATQVISKALSEDLTEAELLSLSRIVILDFSSPELKVFTQAIDIQHGVAEVSNSNFFGLDIRHAYIITSKR